MGTRYAIPRKALLCERGGTFSTADGWVHRTAAGATFGKAAVSQANPAWDLMNFLNNNGGGAGTAEARVPFAQLGFVTADGLETAHTVHLRFRNRTNREVGSGTVIGPAVAIHSGGVGNPGNCYLGFATYLAGTPTVGLAVFAAGVFVILSSAPNQTVRQGDVMSLSYGFDVASSKVNLGLRVNGIAVDAWIDPATTGYRVSALSALPGICGINTPAVPVAHVHGATASEWWVTSGFNHYAEFFDVARLFGGPRLELLTQQRFSTDPAPKVQWYFSKEITTLNFSFKRRGGCASALAVLQLQDWINTDTTITLPPALRSFYEPPAEAWSANDWHGGDVVIRQRHGGQWLRIGTNNVPEAIWRGRISSSAFKKGEKTVRLRMLGHWGQLSKIEIDAEVGERIKLRDALVLLIDKYAVKSPTVDSPIVARNIVGVGHQLEQLVDYDFKHTSLRNAIDRLLRVLPEGFVWGVDATGTLYIQQQIDHYTIDLLTGQLPLLTLNTDNAQGWEPKVAFDKIENAVTVIGESYDEDTEENSTGVVRGVARCDKSVQMYGTRADTKKDSIYHDDGFAAKVAQAMCKRTCAPVFTAKLRVLSPLDGTQSFSEVLTPFLPFVAIVNPVEKIGRQLKARGSTSIEDYQMGNAVMRRYGDMVGTALRGDGDAGDNVTLAPTTTEQNINTSWLLKIRLRFTDAHVGAGGTFAHIFGRPRGGAGNFRKGWGNLVWDRDSGNLQWWFEDSGGSLRGPIVTGINVPSAAPADQIVEIIIYRDATGDWAFYDGPAAKNTSAGFRQTLQTGSFNWRWFNDAAADDEGWIGELDNWAMINTKPAGLRGLEDSNSIAAFATRTAAKPLARNEGVGLLRMCRFNEAHHPGPAVNPRAVWTFETSTGPVQKQYTASLTNILADPSPITTNNRRGFRIGDTIAVGSQAYSKPWGGPLILHVEEVRYSVVPSVGLVDRQLRLGRQPASFVDTVAGLERMASQQEDLMNRLEEDN
jgi:hypothetical protein